MIQVQNFPHLACAHGHTIEKPNFYYMERESLVNLLLRPIMQKQFYATIKTIFRLHILFLQMLEVQSLLVWLSIVVVGLVNFSNRSLIKCTNIWMAIIVSTK